ncbi:sulfotransferase family protein [uncultured Maricaulis sp.]|uniref:sulfotransferase family protein n=1 Tax=uncultured Maricaulis sp. TaxID=174710 RepID=UPI0030D9E739|tara:strand:- start:4673 stop:6109 length:1437 start_codon:yes stop_codon:yes gene_type:complete
MAKVDLVFRQIDERTRDVALALAQEHIRPENTFILNDVRPFTECVNQMLSIEHDCDYVVYVDADCLILEDMRAFIDACDAPYVDSYVSDRFRGRLHCGVHITRIDVVRAMAATKVPENDLKYVLRPESRLRNLAMKPMGAGKQFRNFDILHDHFQSYHHVFMKYALRQLRSRTKEQRQRLIRAMKAWKTEPGVMCDLTIARHAVDFASASVPASATPQEVHEFIEALPQHATAELARMGIADKGDFTREELDTWLSDNRNRVGYGQKASKPKIFGLGLSRTGTRSLTSALQMLGYDCSHYPIDEDTYVELSNAQYDLTILRDLDGLTDITTIPFYPQFDKLYPGSKFVLTVRDRESWLASCARHWYNRPAFKEFDDPDEDVHLRMRQFLRAAVYGCYNYDPERFAAVYDAHVRSVMEYFKDRPEDLLIIDICSGEGFGKLAEFLGRPVPAAPFPHNGAVMSALMLADAEPQRQAARVA